MLAVTKIGDFPRLQQSVRQGRCCTVDKEQKYTVMTRVAKTYIKEGYSLSPRLPEDVKYVKFASVFFV
jgi:hypothetical protein